MPREIDIRHVRRRETITPRVVQIVEQAANCGDERTIMAAERAVRRSMWGEEMSKELFTSPSESTVVQNVFPIRTCDGGVRFVKYPRVPY